MKDLGYTDFQKVSINWPIFQFCVN
jgi:hypothetical protein